MHLVLAVIGIIIVVFTLMTLFTDGGEGKKTAHERATILEPDATPEFHEEWEKLCRYDPRFRNAREKVAPYGRAAELELKNAFFHVRDRDLIQSIAKRIVADLESGETDIEMLERANIHQWRGGNSEFKREGDITVERAGSQIFYWKDGTRYISHDQARNA